MTAPHPRQWLKVTAAGLYVEPADLYVDPVRAVSRAAISHGHGDHARPGHGHVLATAETLAIMRHRLGRRAVAGVQALAYGEPLTVGEVTVRLMPAGHILGSAQIVLDYRGSRAVISGDYKRRADATCAPFEPVACDVFVTEATFGLPVFRHPPDGEEIGKLLRSLDVFPERCHVVGAYGLGKCQRLISLLRRAGYEKPIFVHGGYLELCELYERFGVRLGELRPAEVAAPSILAGAVVLAPPSFLLDAGAVPWPDPVTSFASGWVGVRRLARQRGGELPLIVSDHADWSELTQTLDDVGAPEVWITHGEEAALIHHARTRGIAAEALSVVGYGEEGH